MVSIADQREQNYVLSILNRNHYDYYWIGLNDLDQLGRYEWIKTDGTTCEYKFKWWSKGMPTDSNGARCTFMLFSDHLPGDDDNGQLGKWTKGVCSNSNKFICQTEQVPNKCPTGYNYVQDIDKCYKMVYARKMWHEADNNCQTLYGGSLVNIRDEGEMNALTNYIVEHNQKRKENDQPVFDTWIGLSDYSSPGSLTWTINQVQPSYTNWAFGQPDESLAEGNRCAFLPTAIEQSNKWETSECGARDKGYVCEVASGKTCPTGWTYFKVDQYTEKCVLFVVNGAEHVQWWSARQYCQQRGARFYIPESDSENSALSRYSDDWKRAGVTRLWLGASADDSCQFERDNGNSLGYDKWNADEPKCEDGLFPKCAYFSLSGRDWHTDNCYTKEAFACSVDVGKPIHDIPIEPKDYYCKQNPDLKELPFMYYEDDIVGPMCYQFFKNSGNPIDVAANYTESVAKCTNQGAQIASIHSQQQNTFFLSHTSNMALWIGMGNINGHVPNQWDDGSRVDFMNFGRNEPRAGFD